MRKGGEYRARFAVRNDGELNVSWPDGTMWSDLILIETRPGEVEFRTSGKDGQSLAVTRARIAELGLGRRGAEVMSDILRTGGRIGPKVTDTVLLRLGADLEKHLHLTGNPFHYHEGTATWESVFAVESREESTDR